MFGNNCNTKCQACLGYYGIVMSQKLLRFIICISAIKVSIGINHRIDVSNGLYSKFFSKRQVVSYLYKHFARICPVFKNDEVYDIHKTTD